MTDITIICHSQAISVPPAIDIHSCSCPDHLAYHAISVYPCLREKNERKYYTLSRKKQRNKLNNLMFGVLGNTWRNYFTWAYMSLEKWSFRIFDSRLYKICPLQFSHMFIQGSHMSTMFYAHSYLKNREYPSRTRILRWRPLPDLFKTTLYAVCLHCMALLCM